MAAEGPGSIEAQPPSGAWRPWLQVAAIAGALLLTSEALWLWQTWPVRELLQPAPTQRSTGNP
jgi:hypothetical protein